MDISSSPFIYVYQPLSAMRIAIIPSYMVSITVGLIVRVPSTVVDLPWLLYEFNIEAI